MLALPLDSLPRRAWGAFTRLLDGPLLPLAVPALAAVMLIHHALLWGRSARVPWAELLNHYDSIWYSRIATDGYTEQAYAYFPLYPLLVRGLAWLTSLEAYPSLVGTALSTALFVGFVAAVHRLAEDPELKATGVIPATTMGWALFVYHPGSYVFHSHHTESLFLVLTFATFALLAKGRWLEASVIAGIAGLSRSQGALAAIAVGVGAALLPGTRRERLGRFTVSGLISGAIFALYPLYSWLKIGDPLAFASAKHFWTHAHSPGDALRTLWLGNPWQNSSDVSLWELLLFWSMILALPLVARRSIPLAVYSGLSLLAVLAQGELAGGIRYGTVMFPAIFAIGDESVKASRLARLALLGVVIFLNVEIAWRYCRNFWSY